MLVLFREGRLDLARIWDQEDQGSGKGRAILPLSLSPALLGSAVPTFQGRLEYKGPRAKCFIREKKKKKKSCSLLQNPRLPC